MNTLKLPKSSNYLLCLLATALLLAMTPVVAMATGAGVDVDELAFIPSDVTVNVGDSVVWTHTDRTQAVHTIQSGDYQGRTCQEVLNAYLPTHEDQYYHTFTVAGDCYYRCTLHPPNPAIGYPGMQGVIHVIGGGTTTSTTTTTTTTTMPNQPPSANSLTPVNISTEPGVAQSFTAGYSDSDGWQNISDAGLSLSGATHNESVHYDPTTNKFTLVGASGDCSPGNGATLTNGFLTLNCGTSNASGLGNTLTVTYNLTPQPPLSGAPYQLIIGVVDQGGANNSKTAGYWIVNRRPSADSVSPMNSMTEPMMSQMFTAVYSDPDGWQNIAAANLYFSGNGGMHNEWLHYLAAPNLFTMMGTNDTCSPGQAKMLTNGYLTLDCSSSSISGSGTMLTVVFQVTPEMPSSGIMYNMFSAASDQAGAAYAIFAGTWQIQY